MAGVSEHPCHAQELLVCALVGKIEEYSASYAGYRKYVVGTNLIGVSRNTHIHTCTLRTTKQTATIAPDTISASRGVPTNPHARKTPPRNEQ